MSEPSEKSKIKEDALRKLAPENSLEEDLENLPFGGLPFSFEGRFSALFEEEWEQNSNKIAKKKNRGGFENISDDSFRGLFPLPLIARYKFIPLVAVFAVAVLGSFALIKNAFDEHPIGMTIYHTLVRDGFVEVPLKFVQEEKLVSFEYRGPGGEVPLLAYMTPSGKIGTAVGLSFPCHSDKFHLEGNEIVCDLCFTRWKIETLKGVDGECHAFPPEMIAHFVHKGRLYIREVDILHSVKGKIGVMEKLGGTKT